MSQSFERIKKATVPETIVEQIKDKILNDEITPGDKFPSERDLAEMLGVSRAMVREAMRSLSSLGIVEIRSGEGSFLCLDNSLLSDHFKTKYLLKRYSILELSEARKALESEMVKLATTRGTEERKEYLKKMLMETILQKDLPSSFIKADFNFHMAIAECAQNSFLGEMLNTTRDLLLEINMKVVEQPGQIDKAIQGHKAILEAILTGNVKLAQEEVIAHIDMFTNISSGIYSYHDPL